MSTFHFEDFALYASLIFRSITARFRVLPTVFLLGGTKCATTSIALMLKQHPAFVQPFAKELMYLQHIPNFESNYESDRAIAFLWGRYSNGHAAEFSSLGYRKFFPLTRQMKQSVFRWGAAFTADCDPFNLYCPTATERVMSLVPSAKFIISLRNPVDRAYSDFNMYRSRGAEKRSFEEVVEAELSGSETRFRRRFLEQSIYAPHLRRWFACFPRDRFYVIRTEDFFNDPHTVMKGVFRFLGLCEAELDTKRVNVGEYDAVLSDETKGRVRRYLRAHIDDVYTMLDRNMGW